MVFFIFHLLYSLGLLKGKSEQDVTLLYVMFYGTERKEYEPATPPVQQQWVRE